MQTEIRNGTVEHSAARPQLNSETRARGLQRCAEPRDGDAEQERDSRYGWESVFFFIRNMKIRV